MTDISIIWQPEARDDLLSIYNWIAERADPAVALECTSKIETHVNTLTAFPNRGSPHDDREPSFRTVSYRRRTVIAYRVAGSCVEVLRLFHAGQDWEAG